MKEVLARAIESCAGNVSQAARELGVSRGYVLRRAKGATKRGRPRRADVDDLIAALAETGESERWIANVIQACGITVSRGTVRRRLRELRG